MHKTNILLMEDDHLIAEDIKATLTDQGHHVITGYPDIFNAGEEFPENIDRLVRESHIGLVLMDINLSSQLDGIDLVKHIHKKSDVPVIFISGVSKPYTILRAKETEPYAYLLKPFSQEQLKHQVKITLQLYQSVKEKKSDLAENAGVWHMTTTPSGIKTSFAWLSSFGFDAEYIQSEDDFMAIVHPDDAENIRESVNLLKKRLVKKRAFAYRIVDPRGKTHWILSKIIDARKHTATECHYTILSLDITEQKAKDDELVYDSSRDSLTGLVNKKAFMDKLEKLLLETDYVQKHFAVFVLVLDNFAQITSVHGQNIASQLLKKITGRFKGIIKKKDILAHFEDGKFAFIIRDLKKVADVHFVAQRIINSTIKQFIFDSLELRTSITIGIALPGTLSDNAELLLTNAEKAMEHAKSDKTLRYRIFKPHSS